MYLNVHEYKKPKIPLSNSLDILNSLLMANELVEKTKTPLPPRLFFCHSNSLLMANELVEKTKTPLPPRLFFLPLNDK
jgi:hypothetical protein